VIPGRVRVCNGSGSMVAQHRSEQSNVKKRMEVVFLSFILFVLVLAIRLTYLQWVQGHGFARLAERMHGRTQRVEAERGRIRDRNGAEMATNILGKSIAVNPRLVKDPAATVDRLAELIGLDAKGREAMHNRLVRAKGRKTFYCQLRRAVDRKRAERALLLSKTEPVLRGLTIEDSPVRVYPCAPDGVQLLGQVSSDGVGIEAVEMKLNDVLAGTDAVNPVRVDGTGQLIPLSAKGESVPQDGRDVKLTIDRDVQHFTEQELARVAKEQMPDSATAVVMDITNGDVLSMANWPTYHPSQKKVDPAARKNRAITDLFEPGSTFKVITAAAALEHGVNTNCYCGGSRAIGSRSVRCAHGSSHGAVDLRKMIEKSCNIAAGTLAERVGPENMYHFLDRFGFQAKTGIEFPGEEYGRMLKPEKWRTMRTVNIGFGQGIVVTPIQLVAGYAAIANDGIYNPPRLVSEAPGAGLPRREPRRVMSVENARKLRVHMEAVCTSGTGKAAKIPGYSVAGKTGTAQIAKNGRYGHGYVASFVGFLPVKKPRLAILVSVWHPRRGQYGGVVSAPVFREIARQTVSYLGIPPDQPQDLRDGGALQTFAKHNAPVGGSSHD